MAEYPDSLFNSDHVGTKQVVATGVASGNIEFSLEFGVFQNAYSGLGETNCTIYVSTIVLDTHKITSKLYTYTSGVLRYKMLDALELRCKLVVSKPLGR